VEHPLEPDYLGILGAVKLWVSWPLEGTELARWKISHETEGDLVIVLRVVRLLARKPVGDRHLAPNPVF
jgi:hypothetical protein